MEQSVLNTKAVREVVDRDKVRTLVADWGTKDESIGRLMNQLQGSEAIPLLAIFPAGRPNEPILLQTFYSQSKLLKVLESIGANGPQGIQTVSNLP